MVLIETRTFRVKNYVQTFSGKLLKIIFKNLEKEKQGNDNVTLENIYLTNRRQ